MHVFLADLSNDSAPAHNIVVNKTIYDTFKIHNVWAWSAFKFSI